MEKTIKRLPKNLDQQLARILVSYRHKHRICRLLKDAAILILGCGGFVLLSCLLDRFVDIPGVWRAPLPWLALLILLALLARLLWHWCHPVSYDTVAYILDKASKDNRDHLRTLLNLEYYQHEHDFFHEFSLKSALTNWQGKRGASYVRTGSTLKWSSGAIFLVVLIACAWQMTFLRSPLLWQRFLDPQGNYMRPTATWFSVTSDLQSKLYTGDALQIKTALAGRPLAGTLAPVIRITNADGTTTTKTLTKSPDQQWQVELRNLRQSLKWNLQLGRIRSRDYASPVLPRPTIVKTVVEYKYPFYSGMKTKTETLKSRVITALEGTRVKLIATSNIDLEEATGTTEEETYRFKISRKRPREAVMYRIINSKGKMQLDLISANNVHSKHEMPYVFRPVADNPPSITFNNQLDGQSFFMTDSLDINFKARDDLGIASVMLKAEPVPATYENAGVTIEFDIDKYGAKTTAGKEKVAISELLQGNTEYLKLTLLVKDTKGQDGQSPTATISIASDSFDRQLKQLMLSYTGKPNTREAESRGMPSLKWHEQRLKSLHAFKNNLIILADSLKPKEAVGDNQKSLVAALSRQTKSMMPPQIYGRFWFNDLQNATMFARFRRLAEYANIWSALPIIPQELTRTFDAALKSPNPKQALTAMTPELERLIKLQQRLNARVDADYRLIKAELTGYLSTQLQHELTSRSEALLNDRNFQINARNNLKDIYRYGSSDFGDYLTPEEWKTMETAISENKVVNSVKELAPLLDKLGNKLLKTAVEMMEKRYLEKDLSATSLVDTTPLIPDTRYLLACGIYQMIDNIDEEELFALDCCSRFLYLYTGNSKTFRPISTFEGKEWPTSRDAFACFQTLQCLRDQIDYIITGICAGSIKKGLPETQMAFLHLREIYLALLKSKSFAEAQSPAFKAAFTTLLQSMQAYNSWLTPTELSSAKAMTKMKQIQLDCITLTDQLMPRLKQQATRLQPELGRLQKLLRPALEQYHKDVQAEIDVVTKTKDITPITPIFTLKINLMSIIASAAKILDFYDYQRYVIGLATNGTDRLLALLVIMTDVTREFIDKVEIYNFIYRHCFSDKPIKHAWKGGVIAYEQINKKIKRSGEVLALPESDYEKKLEPILKSMVLWQTFKNQLAKQQALIDLPREIKDRSAFIADLPEDKQLFPAYWHEVLYRLILLQDDLNATAKPPSVDPSLNQLRALTSAFAKPPKEIQDVADFLSELQKLNWQDQETRKDLGRQVGELKKAILPFVEVSNKINILQSGKTVGFISGMDSGLYEKAKYRNRRQLKRDRQLLDQITVGLVFNMPGGDVTSFNWLRTLQAVNQRKTGFGLQQSSLGGIAIADKQESVNLPKHIYEELKRARNRPMPELFKDECYLYLNRVLQKAKGE